nr:hypothetical protein [Olsenella sp. Marseille-P4559]
MAARLVRPLLVRVVDARKRRAGNDHGKHVKHAQVREIGDDAAGSAQRHFAQDDAREEGHDYRPEPVERLSLSVDGTYEHHQHQSQALHKGDFHAMASFLPTDKTDTCGIY